MAGPQTIVLRMKADVGGVTVNVRSVARSMKEAQKVTDKWGASLSKLNQQIKQTRAGAFRQQSGAISKVAFSMKDATAQTDRLTESTNQVGRSFKVVSGVFVSFNKGLIGGLSRAALAMTRFSSGVRQVGQAFLNLGITMSLFIGLPLQRATSGALSIILDLDEALVKVQKTTGLTRNAVRNNLEPALRSLALRVPSTAAELGELSVIAGQLGLKAVPAILGLIEVGTEMASATDLSADVAVTALGRIGAAWGVAESEIGTFARKMGNSITALGNDYAVFESEIVSGMSDAIASAKLLGIQPQELAALVAGLTASGLSPEEAGTATRRGLENIVKNIDAIALATGEEVQHLKDLVDTDAVAFFLDLLDSIQAVPSNADKLLSALGILEVRGIRSLTAEGGTLREALALANHEFEDGNALAIEHARSLTSVNAQLDILKNTLNEVALIIGDAILEDLTDALQHLVAGVQSLSVRFKALPDDLKKWVAIAIAATPVVLLLVTALGSIAFAVGIFAAGLLTMLTVLFSVISAIPALVSAFILLGAALVTGPILFGKKFLEVFTNMQTKVIDPLRRKVAGWGEGIVKSLASGMLQGMAWVIQASHTIASAIAGFFEAHSPPSKGPLSQIVNWGKALMDTYLQAFTLADFGVLKDIGGIVQDILSAFAAEGGIADTDVIPGTLRFREGLSELIDIFNKTGKIASDVLNRITSALGEAGDEVAKLIRLSLQYNAIQKDLADIEKRKTGIDRSLRNEIKLISLRKDLTASERLQMIRRARLRANDAKTGLRDEEELLKTRKDSVGEELDHQKALVDAYKDTTSLQREQIESLEEIAKSMKKAGEAMGAGLDLGSVGRGDLDAFVFETGEAVDSVIEKIGELRKVTDAFFAALLGEPFPHDDTMPIEDPFSGVIDVPGPSGAQQDAFAFGGRIRRFFTDIIDSADAVVEAIGRITDAFTSLFSTKPDVAVLDPITGVIDVPLPAQGKPSFIIKALKDMTGVILALALALKGPGLVRDLGKLSRALAGFSVAGLLNKFVVLGFVSGFITGLTEDIGKIAEFFTAEHGDRGAATGPLGKLALEVLGILDAFKEVFEFMSTLGMVTEKGLMFLITGDVQGLEDAITGVDGLGAAVKRLLDYVAANPFQGLLAFLLLGQIGKVAIGGAAAKGGVARAGIGGLIARLIAFVAGGAALGAAGSLALGAAVVGVIIIILDQILNGGEGREGIGRWLHEEQQHIYNKISEFFSGLEAFFSGLAGGTFESFIAGKKADPVIGQDIIDGLINEDILKEAHLKGERARLRVDLSREGNARTWWADTSLGKWVTGTVGWFAGAAEDIADAYIGFIDSIVGLGLQISAFFAGLGGKESAFAFGINFGDQISAIWEKEGQIGFQSKNADSDMNEGLVSALQAGLGLHRDFEDLGAGIMESIETGILSEDLSISGILLGIVDKMLGEDAANPSTFLGRAMLLGKAFAGVLSGGIGSVDFLNMVAVGIKMGIALLEGLKDAISRWDPKLVTLLNAAGINAAIDRTLVSLRERLAEITAAVAAQRAAAEQANDPLHSGSSIPFMGGGLSGMSSSMTGGGIIVNINNPVVDNSGRVSELANEINRTIGRAASLRGRMGGVTA